MTLLCMTLFALYAFPQSTPLLATDDAHAFEIRINAWMAPYRHEKAEEFDEWLSMAMERDATLAQQHPVAIQMQGFVAEHRDEYIQLRKLDLARYPALENYLSGYEWDPDFQDDLKKEFQGEIGAIDDELNRLQDLSNHRALQVSSLKIITSLVNSAVFDYLSKNRKTPIADYSLHSIFGEKIFVDDVGHEQYCITFLNRLYALQYEWDIRTNRITIPDLYIYAGEKRTKGWLADSRPIVRNTRQRIETELESLVWAMYDEMEPDWDRNEVMDKLEFNLANFYRNNQLLYTDTRQALLSGFPAVRSEKWTDYKYVLQEAEAAFRAELQPIADKEGYSLPLYGAIYDLDGTGIALTIEAATRWETTKTYSNDLRHWLLGSELYTRRLDQKLWEIHCFFDEFASKYIWNIATDEISELVIKSKQPG